MKGLIFNIKRYSVNDGPGIRLTFFMKGCPLSCQWCHNPEGMSPQPELVAGTNRVGAKEFSIMEEVGRYYEPSELLAIAERERPFMAQSGGGVTFSGGEPLMQPVFLAESLELLKRNGYSTAVDTSGYTAGENIKAILPFTDIFLFDIKHLDPAKHLELTGVSNELILSNLELISLAGKDIMLRIPVVPGKNDDAEYISALRNFIASSGAPIRKINLLPYHRTGASKYRRFGIPYRMENTVKPPAERMKELKEFMETTGIKVKIGG